MTPAASKMHDPTPALLADLAELRRLLEGTDQATVVAAMPPVAREIVDAIGFMPAIELLHRIGGKRLRIPAKGASSEDLFSKVRADLVDKVGPEIARHLIDAFGCCIGTQMEMPMLTGMRRLLRDKALRADFDAGVTEEELVDRYQVTSRHVRKLLRASAPAMRCSPSKPPRDLATFRLSQALASGTAKTRSASG